MGASGSFDFSASGYLQGKIDWWEGDYDIANNTSPVTAVLYARRTNNYTTSGKSWSGGVYIGGVGTKISFSSSVGVGNSWVEMARTTQTITHSDDGSKLVTVEGSVTGPSGTALAGNTSSGYQNVTLATIPRASSVSCSSGNIGETVGVYINRKSDSFAHTITYSFGNLSGTIATKTSSTSLGWTIPTSFYAQIPNATSGGGTLTCTTYNGDTQVGTSTCTFTAYVSNSNPIISSVSVTEGNPIALKLTGDNTKLVKYVSNANLAGTATAQNSSTIKSTIVTCGDGEAVDNFNVTMLAVESGTFNFTATDSRGLQTTQTVTLTMVDYIKVAITNYTLERLNSTSNTINLNLSGQYFNGNFGASDNELTLQYRYKENGTDTWSDYVTITPTISNNTFNYNSNLAEEYDFQKAWDFEIYVYDKLTNNTVSKMVSAGIPLIDIWKDNVKVNGTLKCNELIANSSFIYVGSKTASIGKAHASSTSVSATIPDGYTFLCWAEIVTYGWAGSVSPASATNKDTTMWNVTYGSTTSGNGDIVCTYLCIRNE